MTYAHKGWLKDNGGLVTESGKIVSPGLPVARIANPGQSLLVAEGRLHSEFKKWDTIAGDGYCLIYTHNEKLNALFADGHVGSFTKQQCKDNWTLWYDRAVDG